MFDNTMKARRAKSVSGRVVARLFLALAVLCLAGAAFAAASAAGSDAASAPLPEGAVKVGKGIYQVPIGNDEEGCMMYRMHAPGRDVVQVIFYRRADGAFTMAKPEANCRGQDDIKP